MTSDGGSLLLLTAPFAHRQAFQVFEPPTASTNPTCSPTAARTAAAFFLSGGDVEGPILAVLTVDPRIRDNLPRSVWLVLGHNVAGHRGPAEALVVIDATTGEFRSANYASGGAPPGHALPSVRF